MDAILLSRLAFSCVYRHRFTPFSAVNGPKSDPISACLGGSIRGTGRNRFGASCSVQNIHLEGGCLMRVGRFVAGTCNVLKTPTVPFEIPLEKVA